MRIETSGQACGAFVTGLNLKRPLSSGTIDDIREAWLAHHVLVFPGQDLDDDDLERFTQHFGRFGEDPFIAPIPGRRHIIAVERGAAETSPIFAESWHSDWSFQQIPPAGTCLFGLVIPPHGGDTLFANQHMALDHMPDELRRRIDGRRAIHSARAAYAPDGIYGRNDAADRSMTILPSDDALATTTHDFVRRHPETGRPGLFGCLGYIVGFEGMEQAEALSLLTELYHWQGSEAFRYRHQWQPGMLVMWDNRSVLHAATGGYEGHHRLLHRTTIAGR